MTTLLITLIVWIVLSFPVGVLLGRFIKNGRGEE